MDPFRQAYSEKLDIFDQKLSRMLKQPFLFNRNEGDAIIGLAPTLTHPISHRFLEIISLLQAYQDYEAAGVVAMAEDRLYRLYEAYFKLKLLVRDLERIEQYDIALLADIATMLEKSNEDNYYGDRLEIQIISLFINKNIQFTKSESPDLLLTHHNNNIGLECTSVHYDTNNIGSTTMHNKIGKAIRRKARKPYADINIAVVIDITNVHSFSTDTNNLLGGSTSLDNYLTNIVNQTTYGSVILCTYEYQNTPPSLSWNYARRYDSTNINPHLRSFLDEAFGTTTETLVLQAAKVPSTV